MPDGMLLHLRDTYPIETAWAPQYVGDELRQVRAAAWDARLAGSYQALHGAYRQREEVFAATMADRADWDNATVQQRHLAIAADAELHRRHPAQHYPPLRSAEPQPVTAAQRDDLTPSAEKPPRPDADVAQGPGRGPPHVRRHAGGPAKPDDPLPEPGLR